MIFTEDAENNKIIATVEQEDGPQAYRCSITCCVNPVCRCNVATLELNPMDGAGKASRTVGVDFVERSLADRDKYPLDGADLRFAEDFVASLGDDEYQFLYEKHFLIKNGITEETDSASIHAHFNYDAMEQNGETPAYNDILPYGDQLLFTLNGSQGVILDHHCILPKCSCTDMVVTVVLVDQSAKTSTATCSYSLDYADKNRTWTPTEEGTFPVDAQTLRFAVEAQMPDFYERLMKRRKRLKSIYASCKKRDSSSRQPLRLAKVGRNDPCPCGSGKKFKKCCSG